MSNEISRLVISHCLACGLPWLTDDAGAVYLAAEQIAVFFGWEPKTLENRMSESRKLGWNFAEHPAKPKMYSLESVKEGLAHAKKTTD